MVAQRRLDEDATSGNQRRSDCQTVKVEQISHSGLPAIRGTSAHKLRLLAREKQ